MVVEAGLSITVTVAGLVGVPLWAELESLLMMEGSRIRMQPFGEHIKPLLQHPPPVVAEQTEEFGGHVGGLVELMGQYALAEVELQQ